MACFELKQSFHWVFQCFRLFQCEISLLFSVSGSELFISTAIFRHHFELREIITNVFSLFSTIIYTMKTINLINNKIIFGLKDLLLFPNMKIYMYWFWNSFCPCLFGCGQRRNIFFYFETPQKIKVQTIWPQCFHSQYNPSFLCKRVAKQYFMSGLVQGKFGFKRKKQNWE